MKAFDIFFYLFGAVTLVSAVMAVRVSNLVHAAFSLLFTLFGIAGLYVLLSADFLAVTQLLVYVGGILILLLFGVMLTNKVTSIDIKAGNKSTLPAAVLGLLLLGIFGFVIFQTHWMSHNDSPWSQTPYWNQNAVHKLAPPTPSGPDARPEASAGTSREIGKLVMTDYLLPFEVASVLLLIALIGAAMLARQEPVADKRKVHWPISRRE